MLPEFREPWHPADPSDDGLKVELYKEVNSKHVLFGKQVNVIARRQDCDDVLFEVINSNYKFAIVHLTWIMKEEANPAFPATQRIKDERELKQIIEADILEWAKEEMMSLDETGSFVKSRKKIIIVGATSGIGKKMTELYVEKGHLVGITGRRYELLQQIKQQFPQQVEYECFDVTEKENISHIQSLINKLGGLDILVISAGTGEVSKELDWEIDKRTIETNVNGFAEIANWAFNFFIKQDYGQLAVISSIGAIRGNSWAPAYNAAKSFQSSYFEGLSIKARRLKKNVTITCIEPGFVNTKMAKGNKFFWVVPVEKAARQIIHAIEKKKRKVYISRRWWIIAKLVKWMPWWIYKKFG